MVDTGPAAADDGQDDSASANATRPTTSLNLLADSIFANGLGADPTGLVTPEDDYDAVSDLLPLQQRMSPAMIAAHESVDQQVGADIATFDLAQLQAAKTQIALREKQLLTTRGQGELFAPFDQKTFRMDETEPPSEDHSAADSAPDPRLTVLEYAQIREEQTNLDDVVATRATADLVQVLRSESRLEIPGSRQGKTPLASAISYAATALKVTRTTVDRRVSLAASMWPSMNYRRTRLKTPRLASHLERGQIPFATATAAHRRLSEMRQAVRRAGGDETTADELVEHKEKEFLRHAHRNNPHIFARLAKRHSDAVTNELVGPRQTLTEEQVKHEKGVFYKQPIGDRLHELCVVVDDEELLLLKAIREFGTKLDSATASLRAQAHQTSPVPDEQGQDEASSGGVCAAADDIPNNPRITAEDIDLGIAQLFDGQTKAERWLNTLMDFVSAGLILHKTYDPLATADEQQRREQALHKAAQHSEVIADILALDPTEAEQLAPVSSETLPRKDPLEAFIPPGYQLLRPNLDLIVEIPLRDLVGRPTQSQSEESPQGQSTSELTKLVHHFRQEDRGLATPIGSPGNTKIDIGLARQQACAQRIIPMVLGAASQPLDAGRAQRSFPAAIRRSFHVRDRGCIVPGCGKPAEWCHPHHIDEWAKGGPTSLSNGALLCRHHHAAVHKQLLIVHMEDDGLPSCSLPKSLDPTQRRYRNFYWRC